MSTSALSLDVQSTKALFTRFSSSRATMLRGRHGIGKSQVVYQIAGDLRHDFYKSADNCRRASEALGKDSGFVRMVKDFFKVHGAETKYADMPRNQWHYDMGVPVIERRLSQMTEGDITGIPFEGSRGGTVFRAVEWLLGACEYPTVLFLDELNRAIKGVEQATFQLADSKAFDGNVLHEGTRVMVAVNIGDAYDVQPMDPAALSRYAVIDLEPSLKDWLTWADKHCDQALVEFIRANEKFLEYKGMVEPNQKTPDRRAWANLDAELTASGLYETPENVTFYHMTASMVGIEAAGKFWTFVKDRDADISAKDVLKDWKTCEKRLPKDEGKRNAKFVDIMAKVNHLLTTHVMNDKERAEYVLFFHAAPAEVRFTAWKGLGANHQNLVSTHHLVKGALVTATSGAAAGAKVGGDAAPAAAPAATPAATPKPRTKKA